MGASIIAAVAAVAVAIIEAVAQVQRSRTAKADEYQRRLAMAQYDVSSAQTDGLRILLKHAHGERLNGDVEAAIKALDTAEAEYTRIRTEIVSNAL
ncbi:MAG: hypothetical protein IJJ14_03060 [Coriobacteriales bacterium]|nr:hypothetical protein [Coriobacteriales bacterium]